MWPLKAPMGSPKGRDGALKASQWDPQRTLMGLPKGPDEALKAPIGPLRFVIGPPKSPLGPLRILMGPLEGPNEPIRPQWGPLMFMMGPLGGPLGSFCWFSWVRGKAPRFSLFLPVFNTSIRSCSALLASLGSPGTE
jgi:hypothetical protein